MSSQTLTAREWEVARLVAYEKSNKEIAHILGIAVPTVRGHIEAIYLKLDVHSRVGLTRWVLEHDA